MYLYRFIDKNNEIIYIGKAKNIKQRMMYHFKQGHLDIECYRSIDKIEYIEIDNEYETMIKEIAYIGLYKPIYNSQFKVNDPLPNYIKILLTDTWNNFLVEFDMEEKIKVLKEQIEIENKKQKLYEEYSKKQLLESMEKIVNIL